LKDIQHLTCCFNKHLQIDYKLANEFIEQDLERKLNDFSLRDINFSAKRGDNIYTDPIEQYNSSKIAIYSISRKDWFFKVDDKGKRLHTSLTNLKGVLRNCLSYDNQTLVSIDVANSQPYLANLLFNQTFGASF
jgi:hypothetical protein